MCATQSNVQLNFFQREYNPSDYEHLAVSSEIKQIFSYITYYTPQIIDIEMKLKPFIPDYIPAVGDIDAFIKVSRTTSKVSKDLNDDFLV